MVIKAERQGQSEWSEHLTVETAQNLVETPPGSLQLVTSKRWEETDKVIFTECSTGCRPKIESNFWL